MLRSLLFRVQPYPHLKPILYENAERVLFNADEEINNPGDSRKINELVQQLVMLDWRAQEKQEKEVKKNSASQSVNLELAKVREYETRIKSFLSTKLQRNSIQVVSTF
jgi:hypothetical protein